MVKKAICILQWSLFLLVYFLSVGLRGDVRIGFEGYKVKGCQEG